MEEKFEDTKGVFWSRKSKKDRQHNGQKKWTKGQTTINTSLLRNLNMNPTENRGWTREGLAVPAPHVAPVMLLLRRHEHHMIWKLCWTAIYVNKYK